jgi:non-heme chloroperoxidase
MQAGLKKSCASVMSLLTDFTEDLEKVDVPTLILHGEDDQMIPAPILAMKAAGIIKDAKDLIYPGAPHGIRATHQEESNSELLRFVES